MAGFQLPAAEINGNQTFTGNVTIEGTLNVEMLVTAEASLAVTGTVVATGSIACGGGAVADGAGGADDGVFGDGVGTTGLTIFSGIAGTGNVVFTDVAATVRGRVNYTHSNDRMNFATGGVDVLTLFSGALFPSANGVMDLGGGGNRYDEGFINVILVAGAVAADAAATADDVVVGSGGGGSFGQTFNIGAGGAGQLAWNNGTNDENGALRYDGVAGSEAFTIRVRNVNRLGINDVAFFPLVAFDLGASGSRFQDAFLSGALNMQGDLNHDGINVGLYGTAPAVQSAAYTRNATIVEDRTLLQSSAATTLNNNNVLAALIGDLQSRGFIG